MSDASKAATGNAVADVYALGFQAGEGGADDLRRKLARAQAYNACLTRHVVSLIALIAFSHNP